MLTKALPTLVTLIRLLPGVYSVVANEAAFATEGFATIFTLVRGLFSVHFAGAEVWSSDRRLSRTYSHRAGPPGVSGSEGSGWSCG